MGLEVVLNQIIAAGQQEEASLTEQAQFERERILEEANAKAEGLRQKSRAQADARLEGLRRELLSAAEFEARRQLLVARRELAEDFLAKVRAALSNLPANRNQALLAKLLEKAKSELPQGTAVARKADVPILSKAGYKAGAELRGLGGFQIESVDGAVVLDYRFETLLENAWKQILSEHEELFEA